MKYKVPDEAWQEFANKYNLTNKEFANEIMITAQGVMAMELEGDNCSKLDFRTTQFGVRYKLTFERVD